MGEKITVPCLHCGDEIAFEIETWASPPERAFCGDGCYEDHQATATPNPAAPAT